MNVVVAATFALAAGAGAVVRHETSRRVRLPWSGRQLRGTLVVNIVGCLLAGVVAGLARDHGLAAEHVTVAAVGFAGSLTTFSTLAVETVRLAGQGAVRSAVVGLCGSLALGAAAVALGWGITAL